MNVELNRYTKACIAKGEATEHGNIKAANKQASVIFAEYKLLKENNRLEELLELLSHENPYVRLAAATHSLQFPKSNAEKILKELERSSGEVGVIAHMALFAWHNGAINF